MSFWPRLRFRRNSDGTTYTRSRLNIIGDAYLSDDSANDEVKLILASSLASLTVKEVDGTPNVTDVEVIRVSNGTLTNDGGGQVSIDTTGGGGSGVPLFFPDLPPSSPGTNDNEFAANSGGTPSGWTEWDVGGRITPNEGAYGVKLPWTASHDELSGIYRAVPAGDFTLVTKVQMSTSAVGGTVEAGFMLAEDLGANPSTADIQTFEIRTDAGTGPFYFLSQRWTAYNAISSTTFQTNFTPGVSLTYYLRLRRISTTYYFDTSEDGFSWLQRMSLASPFTVAHVVLGGASRSTDPMTAYFRFYRETSSTAIDQVLQGDTG
jgi:hypothetical protein